MIRKAKALDLVNSLSLHDIVLEHLPIPGQSHFSKSLKVYEVNFVRKVDSMEKGCWVSTSNGRLTHSACVSNASFDSMHQGCTKHLFTKHFPSFNILIIDFWQCLPTLRLQFTLRCKQLTKFSFEFRKKIKDCTTMPSVKLKFLCSKGSGMLKRSIIR